MGYSLCYVNAAAWRRLADFLLVTNVVIRLKNICRSSDSPGVSGKFARSRGQRGPSQPAGCSRDHLLFPQSLEAWVRSRLLGHPSTLAYAFLTR
jgi:hypothetical protein